ncbi:MAG TPA: glycosyltransferase family 4 protein [Tepidisphaeraceae bacterium]|nr:glycosyltransferase family 4 protein [Tepidisphaeraceae bacterium]
MNASPPRILFFDHTATLGGGEIALFNLVTRLDRQRFQPIVLLAADGPLRQRLDSAGVEVHLLLLPDSITAARKDSLGPRTLLRAADIVRSGIYVLRLAIFLHRSQIDLLHTNSLKSDLLGGVAARLAGVPVVWHIRDRIDPDYLPAPVVRIFRWLSRRLPNAIVANSDATLKSLNLCRDQSADRPFAQVIHDGTPAPASPPIRQPDGFFHIGLIGRITPWKGQHIFIQAAAAVHAQFPNTRFQIIGAPLFGEESYQADLRSLVQNLNLSDVVEFTGFRTDIPDLLSQLDLLVHASTTGEPFGQVVIEAMAAGKPVVATNGGGIPEIVLDGQTGLLIPMSDPASMSAAICRIIANPKSACDMGRLGRVRVQNHFTIEHTTSKVERLYDELLAPDHACRPLHIASSAI